MRRSGVAGNLSGVNLNNYDLVYYINANASIIGGPSAGAALTIATIAALTGKKPNQDVMITGTINSDGSIGPIGDVLEKAKAAQSVGASTFLIPLSQSKEVVYETVNNCQTFGTSEICTQETRPRSINIVNETSINIKEVSTIKEAEAYFFS